MKKLLLLLIIPFISFGQDDKISGNGTNLNSSEIEMELINLQNHLQIIYNNLDNHHNTYKTGMLLTISSFGVGTVGVLAGATALSIIAIPVGFIGYILIWDSDRYFSKKYMFNNGEILYNENKDKIEQSITKVKEKKEIAVCDCYHVFMQDYTKKRSARKLYRQCENLMKIYNVRTDEGLKKWKKDAENGGCL